MYTHTSIDGWSEVIRQRSSHVYTHIVRCWRGNNLEDVRRTEGVDLGIDHGVYSQDVCQLDLLVVVGTAVRLVECQGFGVQPPIVLLPLLWKGEREELRRWSGEGARHGGERGAKEERVRERWRGEGEVEWGGSEA